MAMVKVFSPSGWDFDSPVAGLVKIASGGLRGNDRADFIKRASGSHNVFLPYLDSVKFASDEEPVHLLAVGASEAYGPNRNGDGFREKTCQDYHDTFVKHAYWFRNHKNKKHEGNPHYGTIKLSAYNPTMRRIELLVGLNREKSAADRNNGLVADKELEKLARGEDIAVSMACRVPYDECSYCNHKARTREEYCTGEMCKAGGCKTNLTRLIKSGNDVHVLHVNNPSPAFFDISNVFRPADRIAYAGKADYLDKMASDGFGGIDGAKMAQDMGLMAPLAVILSQDNMLPGEWRPYLDEQVKLAGGLAELEKKASLHQHATALRAFSSDVQPPLDYAKLELDPSQPVKMSAALGALADFAIILPMREFAHVTKRAELAEEATKALSGVYSRMIEDGTLAGRISNNHYAPGEKMASFKQRKAAEAAFNSHSLHKEAVHWRCSISTLRRHQQPDSKSGYWNEKQAADNPQAEELARDYAVYKLAALRRIAQTDTEFLLTASMAMAQNQVV